MGDWGHDVLSNDPAQDFLIDVLSAENGWRLVSKALNPDFGDDEQDRRSLV